jgi:hypothetical protein
MIREDTSQSKYCVNRVMGVVCISAGIIIMAVKFIYFIQTNTEIPMNGRGQFLVGTGASLLLGKAAIDKFTSSRKEKA